MVSGAEAQKSFKLYAALKRRSSTSLGSGVLSLVREILLGQPES